MNILLWLIVIISIVFIRHLEDLCESVRIWRFAMTQKGPSLWETFKNSRRELILPFLSECAEKYGPRFVLYHGSWGMYVCDSAGAKVVLSSPDLIAKSNNYRLLRDWLGDSLLLKSGDQWHQTRKFLTPAFHFNSLKKFSSTIVEQCDILIEKLGEQCHGLPVNVTPFLAYFSLDVVQETAMGVGKNTQHEQKSAYVDAVDGLTNIFGERQIKPWLKNNYMFRMSRLYKEQERLLKIAHGETDDVIKKRRDLIMGWDLEALQEEKGDQKQRFAFLDLLLIAQLGGHPITDAEIRQETDVFMFGGHDTTSVALSYILLQLAQNPECQERAFQEALEFEDMEEKRMPYVDAVIKETLRLYPSIPFVARQADRDFKLDDGLTVPKGFRINVQIQTLQRNPEASADPDTFRPERFLDGTEHAPFTLVPFSAGPRNCIGQKYAQLELKLVLPRLLRRFKFLEAKDAPKPELVVEIVLKSTNGVHLILEKRDP